MIAIIMVWVLVIAVVVIMVEHRSVAKRRQDFRQTPSQAVDKDEVYYVAKPFMTNTEKTFFEKILPLNQYGINIIPQIPLASVVKKQGEYRWQNELYRIIDFGIFDSNYNLLLLVELNDTTHKQQDRYIRDKKVRNICSDAGIDLMTFYVDKPNEQDYILHRIADSIRKTKVST